MVTVLKPLTQHRVAILKVISAVILGFLMYLAASFGIANLYFKQAQHQLNHWQFAGNVSSERDYRQALDDINSALLFHSRHNQYLELKAQILEWGADDGIVQPTGAVLMQAKQLYLQSISSRPAWPATWAALAMLKWRLQEFDGEMIGYLQQAFKTGKNSPEVKFAFLELGKVLADYYPHLFQQIESEYRFYQSL
ncbi:hypothetical protein [Thalassotalea mangrovi]|uniref:Tetratricopeptide repeat protein n=1 Tax=Thalassotalea mangrovi TaxID=2572245 RepID=A0A4U1B4H6_9GAMM|nr:hypothetical protein [Thalassotalea mangrovi]TKB44654.1 hypothetical protein E8M12_10980 [Thalassotalea mangrovi]